MDIQVPGLEPPWASGPPPRATMRAANDNAGRKVIVKLKVPQGLRLAEVEVFGALIAEIDAAANDNTKEESAK